MKSKLYLEPSQLLFKKLKTSLSSKPFNLGEHVLPNGHVVETVYKIFSHGSIALAVEPRCKLPESEEETLCGKIWMKKIFSLSIFGIKARHGNLTF